MSEAIEMLPADYARHRGVTRQAIDNLLRKGKIPFRLERGKKLIDAAAADRALGNSRERVEVPADDDLPPPGAGNYGTAEPSGLTKAKTAAAAIDARIKHLDYEERVGKLLPIEGVTRAMEKCAGAIVRDLDQLPNFAEELATAFTAGGIPAVRAKLKDIARGTRIILAETMRATAAASTQVKTDHLA